MFDFYDIVIGIFYFFLIILVAYFFYKKFVYKKSFNYKFFMPYLIIKLISSLILCIIFKFYYYGGDNVVYFLSGQVIANALMNNFSDGIQLLIYGNPLNYSFLDMTLIHHSPTYFLMCRITSVFYLLGLGSFIGSSFLYSVFGFLGSWKLYQALSTIYPRFHKQMIYGVLFVPSFFFWSSGILKDTLCVFSLGLLFYSIVNVFYLKVKYFSSFILIILNSIIILSIKDYIIYSFGLSFLIVNVIYFISQIKFKFLRYSLYVFMLNITVVGFVVFHENISVYINDLIVENFMSQAVNYNSILSTSDSGYTLFDINNLNIDVKSLMLLIPASINVTLFRPYIWEANKPIIMISALESLGFLFFTLYCFIKVGLINFFSIMFKNKYIFFSLLFAIIFAFSVGLSSGNFGSLTRYKIIFVPFYCFALYSILKIKEENKNNLKLPNT